MKIFIDSSDLDEIKEAAKVGIDGVTTNPTLASKYAEKIGLTFTPENVREIMTDIADIVNGPISVETVGSPDYSPDNITVNRLVDEAKLIHSWHPNFVIKIPAIPQGLEATRILHPMPVNMTLVFRKESGFYAGLAGAAFCSPFVGRLDDIGEDGMAIPEAIIQIYKEKSFATEVLTASVRKLEHVFRAYEAGSHIATLPLAVFNDIGEKELMEMRENNPKSVENPVDVSSMPLEYDKKELEHPLLTKGLKIFLEDAKKVDYKIL